MLSQISSCIKMIFPFLSIVYAIGFSSFHSFVRSCISFCPSYSVILRLLTARLFSNTIPAALHSHLIWTHLRDRIFQSALLLLQPSGGLSEFVALVVGR